MENEEKSAAELVLTMRYTPRKDVSLQIETLYAPYVL